MTRSASVLALLVLAASMYACNRAQPAEEASGADTAAVPVVASAAQRGAIRTAVHATGMVTPPPDGDFIATAPETATVLEIPKGEGQPAASGDVLVRLEIPTAAQNVARQQAEVARQQALLENARVAQSRARDLVERGLVARLDLENADREVAEADAALARAQAARVAAEAAAARTMIRAPFAGVVARQFHMPGDVVPGQTEPILRFVDPARLEVTVMVPVADSARIVQGATARIASTAGGPVVPLTVLGRANTSTTGNVGFKLAFAEPTTLPVDTTVEVDIDADERTDVVFVIAEAVVRDGGSPVVFVAVGGRAERRPVTVGLMDETRIEITSGLQAGEMVIVQGQVGLLDGTPITVDVR